MKRAKVIVVILELSERVAQLDSDLLNEPNAEKRLELRQRIHEFETMIENLEQAI